MALGALGQTGSGHAVRLSSLNHSLPLRLLAAPALLALALASPASAQVNSWLGQHPVNVLDTWSNAGEWSLGVVPDGSTDIRIGFDAVGGDTSFTNRNIMIIDVPATLIVESPTTVTNAGGSISNSGSVQNNGTVLNQVFGALTNTNTGIFNNNAGALLSNDAGAGITNLGSLSNNSGAALTNRGFLTTNGTLFNNSGATLTNLGTITGTGILFNSGTIQGGGGNQGPIQGGVFSGGLALVNEAGGTINANVSNSALTLSGQGGITNAGLMEVTGVSSYLIARGVTINNGGGAIAAANGGVVALDNATVMGGTLVGGTVNLGGGVTVGGIAMGSIIENPSLGEVGANPSKAALDGSTPGSMILMSSGLAALCACSLRRKRAAAVH